MTLRVLMMGPGLGVRGGVSSVERLILDYAPADVEFKFISTMENGSPARKIAVFLKAYKEARKDIDAADVVHIHFSIKGSTMRKMMLAGLVKKRRKPLVLHAHGGAYHEFFERQKPGLQRRIKKFITSADRFIALSERWVDFYSGLGVPRDKITALPNPVVVLESYPERSGRDSVCVLYLGYMHVSKGAFDLATAFADAWESHPNLRIVMAGDGMLGDIRKILAKPLDAGAAIVAEWIPADERDRLLSESDIFCLPSYNEGMPMAMLEAMSWGLPPIVTPVGGIPEVVKDRVSGVLVEPGNVEELSAAIIELACDEQLRLAIGKEAHKAVEPFDIKQYNVRLADIYRQLARP